MNLCDWSSDVCSSDLIPRQMGPFAPPDMTACRQWRKLFYTWVNGVFGGKLNG